MPINDTLRLRRSLHDSGIRVVQVAAYFVLGSVIGDSTEHLKHGRDILAAPQRLKQQRFGRLACLRKQGRGDNPNVLVVGSKGVDESPP
jgi:hypothetical protein